jgi:hypothetical protein
MIRNITIGFFAGVLAFFTFQFAWFAVTFWSVSRDIAAYLPAAAPPTGVSIKDTTNKVFRRSAARNFEFEAKSASNAGEAAELFQPRLISDGWLPESSASQGNVATSSWRHPQRLSGHLHLIFTVLDFGSGNYFGTMETTFR